MVVCHFISTVYVVPRFGFGNILHVVAGACHEIKTSGIPTCYAVTLQILPTSDSAALQQFIVTLLEIVQLLYSFVVIFLTGHMLLENLVLCLFIIQQESLIDIGKIISKSLLAEILQCLLGILGIVNAPPIGKDGGEFIFDV